MPSFHRVILGYKSANDDGTPKTSKEKMDMEYEVVTDEESAKELFIVMSLAGAMIYWKGSRVIYPIKFLSGTKWLCGTVSVKDLTVSLGKFVEKMSNEVMKKTTEGENAVPMSEVDPSTSLSVLWCHGDLMIEGKTYRGSDTTRLTQNKNEPVSKVPSYIDLNEIMYSYLLSQISKSKKQSWRVISETTRFSDNKFKKTALENAVICAKDLPDESNKAIWVKWKKDNSLDDCTGKLVHDYQTKIKEEEFIKRMTMNSIKKDKKELSRSRLMAMMEGLQLSTNDGYKDPLDPMYGSIWLKGSNKTYDIGDLKVHDFLKNTKLPERIDESKLMKSLINIYYHDVDLGKELSYNSLTTMKRDIVTIKEPVEKRISNSRSIVVKGLYKKNP